jgi:cytochrome c oxidase assembly protein subunit 11
MTGGNGQQQDKRKRGGNARVALLLAGVVCGMVGLSFASVPLYRIFCQVTGLGGTTQQADALPDEAIERMITVRFNADIDSSLPWRFKPGEKEVKIKVGEQGLTFYKAASLADFPTTGHATYNVTPLKAGLYFNKIHCFCFDEQTLAGGEEVDMGVNFFIDPAINEDPNLDDVQTITLSYTFFRTPEDQENGGEKSEQLTHFNDGEGAKAEAGTIN